MSLKLCKECKKEVSSKAKTCPSCGAPVKTGGTATSIARIILMVLAILLLLPALFIGGPFGLLVPAILFIMALCLK
ncbi:MAG TPA: hypothetical protein DET40_10060 [Lentisphaeria bacterium]|nr:MAG: hypothetical protein A2X45_08845 [Lentisphaerae bacterium GWF2_50_93]HCE43879.1 hypothetical protein [Lentisphaeria bacterium]